jgi:hypothetical protein
MRGAPPRVASGSRRPACRHIWIRRGRAAYQARGSGVHVRIGRTIAFHKRDQALRRHGYGVWGGINGTVLSYSDRNVAKAAARERFASVQLLYGNPHILYGVGSAGGSRAPARELILTHEVCMHQPQRLGAACVPVKTRTGWNASLPCMCSDAATVGAVGLNCGSAALELQAAGLTQTQRLRGPQVEV